MKILVADECWIALALLHRENPGRQSFTAGEIVNRLKSEAVHPEVRPGVQPHIHQHLVANRKPNSGRYRMFYQLPDGTLRLFRFGDDFVEERRNGKIKPDRRYVPERYHVLLDWYDNEYSRARNAREEDDPVLQMLGVGQEIWKDEGGDAFIERERREWDEEEQPRRGVSRVKPVRRVRTGSSRG